MNVLGVNNLTRFTQTLECGTCPAPWLSAGHTTAGDVVVAEVGASVITRVSRDADFVCLVWSLAPLSDDLAFHLAPSLLFVVEEAYYNRLYDNIPW